VGNYGVGMTDAHLEALRLEVCLELLRVHTVGRVAVIVGDFPLVFPVNYTVVETERPLWIALRTRPGNVIDRASKQAAFEIDQIDHSEQEGWSVLVRGTFHHVDPDNAEFRERFDPQPWLEKQRDAWLVLEPFSITGRMLRSPQPDWPLHLGDHV
jgi:nitroimidazol reductase NimA-like FMN-containing flavoprotein (pyridoxamine 5'-phosphate oxidase superfamily)